MPDFEFKSDSDFEFVSDSDFEFVSDYIEYTANLIVLELTVLASTVSVITPVNAGVVTLELTVLSSTISVITPIDAVCIAVDITPHSVTVEIPKRVAYFIPINLNNYYFVNSKSTDYYF